MKKNAKLFITILALVLIVYTLFFYRGFYLAPPVYKQSFDLNIGAEPTSRFFGELSAETGLVIVDNTHGNSFVKENMAELFSQIVSRGYRVEFVSDNNFSRKIRAADALIITAPTKDYTLEERLEIKNYVEKGGRLLLLGENTAELKINDLALEFGIYFEPDYIYNLQDEERNFKLVNFTNFARSSITQNLSNVTLYNACSITTSKARGVLFGDDNTYSSISTDKIPLTPAVETENVLAICDQTFIEDQYNTLGSNSQFIYNIVDWLVSGSKRPILNDFPYYFKKQTEVIFDNEFLKTAISLKNYLENNGVDAKLSKIMTTGDKVIIANFDSQNLGTYLSEASVPLVEKNEFGFNVNGFSFKQQDAAYVKLNENNGRYTVLILADNEEILRDAITLLNTGGIKGYMIDDYSAIILTK